MSRFNCLINGALLGAVGMYFFDPKLGRLRRVHLENQIRRFSRRASEGLDAVVRDLKNGAQGTVTDVQHRFSPHDRRQARPHTQWPPASTAPTATGNTTSECASGCMSSGDKDRPDVWPQSRVSPSKQTSLPGPFADQ
jgi:hypothetical protein